MKSNFQAALLFKKAAFLVFFQGFSKSMSNLTNRSNSGDVLMKFTICRDLFYRALADISKITVNNDQLPLLNGVKLIADSRGLTLIASNLTIFIETILPQRLNGDLMILEEGSIVVPAKYLIELVKKMPGRLTVTSSNQTKVSLQSVDIHIQMNAFNAEDFPALPDAAYLQSFIIPASELIDMFKQTSYAAAVNGSRPVLSGVLLSLDREKLICAATNSHRLALKEREMNIGFKGTCIIPLPAVKEIVRQFQNEKRNVTVYVSDNSLIIKSPNISLYTRLIEGTYPKLSGLIPKELNTIIRINGKQFLKGIERASLFARDLRNNHIKLEIKEGTSLFISSHSNDIGKIEEKQQCEYILGDKELVISLDGNFLSEALRAVAEEQVTLSFTGTMKPLMIQPASSTGLFHLISPVRT